MIIPVMKLEGKTCHVKVGDPIPEVLASVTGQPKGSTNIHWLVEPSTAQATSDDAPSLGKIEVTYPDRHKGVAIVKVFVSAKTDSEPESKPTPQPEPTPEPSPTPQPPVPTTDKEEAAPVLPEEMQTKNIAPHASKVVKKTSKNATKTRTLRPHVAVKAVPVVNKVHNDQVVKQRTSALPQTGEKKNNLAIFGLVSLTLAGVVGLIQFVGKRS